MNELHWTGAALLLAVAVLDTRTRQEAASPRMNWNDFAPRHGLTKVAVPSSKNPAPAAVR
jgi:hypothetical protein